IRWIDDDLAIEKIRLLRNDLSHVIEPEGEHDCVGSGDCVLNRGGARVRPEFVCERLCLRLVPRSDDHRLAACDEVPGDSASDVADADDCGTHRDSFFPLPDYSSLTWSESSPKD